MQGPYRERVCGVCGSSAGPTVECTICRREACAACLQDDACRACHDRALELVLRRLATHGPGPLSPPPRPSRLVTTLRIASVALLATMSLAVIPRALCMTPAPRAAAVVTFLPTLLPSADDATPQTAPIGIGLRSSDWDDESDALWYQAKWLASRGAPITCVDARVSFHDFLSRPWEREIAEIARTEPSWTSNLAGGVVGLRLEGVDPRSFLAVLGVRAGDVIASVNGRKVSQLPDRRDHGNRAVIELKRGDKRIILGVRPPGG